jgi:hypothetical protein
MSHFTVLVPAVNEEELEAMLLPYHEYECTGIKEYTKFVPADMVELQADHKKYGKNESLEEFAEDWAGYKKNSYGVYGRITNPNSKWDWWLVGGRWTGMLQLKSLAAREHAGDGKPGLMTEVNTNVLHADYARVGDVDWEGMEEDKTEAATYAFIDRVGKWNQRGEMGWWACDDPSKGTPSYDKVFWSFIDSLPDEQRIYIVDCHI